MGTERNCGYSNCTKQIMLMKSNNIILQIYYVPGKERERAGISDILVFFLNELFIKREKRKIGFFLLSNDTAECLVVLI